MAEKTVIYQAVIELPGNLVEGVMHTTISGRRVQLREPVAPFKDVPEQYQQKVKDAAPLAVSHNPNKIITLNLYQDGELETRVRVA